MKLVSTSLGLLCLVCALGGQESGGVSPADPMKIDPDVKEWMRSNPELASIRTLEQFRVVPHDLQRQVFQTLPAELQSQLWKSKLAEILVSGQLDDRQLGVVAMADCFLTSTVYGNPRATAVDNFLLDLETDARAVFPEEQFNALFMTLGRSPGAPEAVASTDGSAVAGAATAVPAGDCTCYTQRDYCGSNARCVRNGCTYGRWGCGYLWTMPCNGQCVRRIRR
jgi:hypothetical protein